MSTNNNQITVRLPSDVAEQLAVKEARSAYVVEAIREKLMRDEVAAIEESLLSLIDEEPVDAMFLAAQAEAMTRVD